MTGGQAGRRTGGQTVLVAGATSAIARGVAVAFARRGYGVILAGRDTEETRRIATDLTVRYGVATRALTFDAAQPELHEVWVQALIGYAPELDGVVICFGQLGDQVSATQALETAKKIVDVNYTGAVTFLTPIANWFEQRGRGFIGAFSSVAGDRGRQSNYVYGSAKGALALFLQGLRQRLAKKGVSVTTIKPGFVDTRMTYGMPGLFLVAKPEDVGERAVRAVLAGKPVVYLPWFWRYIMLIIKLIPERVFMRLKL